MSALAAATDADLLGRLRAGDEEAFTTLVRRHERSMLRVAAAYVRTEAAAEEVVQEAWVGLLRGLAAFQGRSSLKTYLFRILVNRARSRGQLEARSVPFSALEGDGEDFLGDGHWAIPPREWPQERLLERELLEHVRAVIAALPERQRDVLVLRDVVGCDAQETCQVLGLSYGNQRVLLHRARAAVRQAIDRRL